MNGTKSHDTSALIFDIQRFSLHDGPGIRTTVFFKGCPLKCAWCQNPESHQKNQEIFFYKETCLGCLKCKETCKNDAIMDDSDQRIDYSACSLCGDCVSTCDSRSLRMVGQYWDIDALTDEILKDQDYFIDSNGGVTLSGGEPMLQADFFKKLLPGLRALGIHINMETCGMFSWENFEEILPCLDLVFFDLKHMDSIVHKKYTGCDNRIILENFTKLSHDGTVLQARMPVIPGINDDPENISATAQFLRKNGRKSIHCLPYHHMGESKILRMNTTQELMNLRPLTAEDLLPVKERFKKEGIDAMLYD